MIATVLRNRFQRIAVLFLVLVLVMGATLSFASIDSHGRFTPSRAQATEDFNYGFIDQGKFCDENILGGLRASDGSYIDISSGAALAVTNSPCTCCAARAMAKVSSTTPRA